MWAHDVNNSIADDVTIPIQKVFCDVLTYRHSKVSDVIKCQIPVDKTFYATNKDLNKSNRLKLVKVITMQKILDNLAYVVLFHKND